MSKIDTEVRNQNNNQCAVCGIAANSKCAACSLVSYCSKQHQKSHWKVHKNECICYEVLDDPRLGRYLASKRTINASDIIIRDDPLIVGPTFPTTEPVCIKCLRDLKKTPVESLCEQCLWPVCPAECEPLKCLFSHRETECNVLARAADTVAKSNEYKYEIITPLRCILLQIVNKNDWCRFVQLQSHLSHRGPESEVYEEINAICNHLKHTYLTTSELDSSAETIHKVCGILDVNSVDVQLSGINLTAVYPVVSLLEHSCLPNIRLSFDESGRACVYATRKINKGEHLSTMYTNALWGTRGRRAHLMATKYFSCNCTRCSSNTELGTHFSTVICNAKEFCKGNLTPTDPLNDSSSWECDRCPTVVSSDRIDTIIADLSLVVDEALQNPGITLLEKTLEKLTTFVHSNHYLCFNIKHTLVQIYGHLPGYKHSKLSAELLERKSKLCREMFSVLNVIDPLYVRLNLYTSVVLHELHLVLLETANRMSKSQFESKGMIDEAKVLLLKALEMLENEPEGSPGSKLLQAYKSSTSNSVFV